MAVSRTGLTSQGAGNYELKTRLIVVIGLKRNRTDAIFCQPRDGDRGRERPVPETGPYRKLIVVFVGPDERGRQCQGLGRLNEGGRPLGPAGWGREGTEPVSDEKPNNVLER